MLTNRTGLALAALGAAALMTAATLVRFQDGGWMLIAASIAIGAGALWASRGNHRGAVLPVALCVLASVPVLTGAALSGSAGRGAVLLPHVIAAVGLATALAGSLLLARRQTGVSGQFADPPTASGYGVISTAPGSCPQCKRPITAAASTCGYCGFAVKSYRNR